MGGSVDRLAHAPNVEGRLLAGRREARRWPGRLIFALLSVAIYASSMAFAASPAYACEENGVFWSMRDATFAVPMAWGATQEITLSNQSLVCVVAGADAGTGHTSRILLGGQAGNYVEAGHMNKICASGNPCQRAFMSWTAAGVPAFKRELSFSCLNPGTRHAYMLQRENGGGTWVGWMSCYATYVNWTDLNDGPTPNLGYNQGFPEGEGFERGFVGDGWQYEGPMKEDHLWMQWLEPMWAAWHWASGLVCRADDSYRWDGSQTGSMHMTLNEVHRGPGC